MKNCYTFLFTIFCLTALFSQKPRNFELTGTVFSDSLPIENVHVINKTSFKGSITNSHGVFTLPVKVGDTLHISHINFEVKKLVISVAEKSTKNVFVNLSSKTHTLNEITLKKRRSIFYTDPQIIPQSMVNATTLKLPYATVITKKNEDITNFSLTSASVNLDNLINFFNGNAKKAKELKREKLKDHRLDKIRTQFTDFFFVDQLKIEKRYINQFLNYCLNSGIITLYNKGNDIKITALLISESKTFPHKQIDVDTLLVKH
mgnify:CR=1 FL=1